MNDDVKPLQDRDFKEPNQGLTDPDKVVYGPVQTLKCKGDNEVSIETIQQLIGTDDMKIRGAIRAKGKCPVCGENFKEIPRLGFICLTHHTVPQRFYVDVSWKNKRPRAFSDKSGQVLDSYQRAQTVLGQIQYEIENGTFNPDNYMHTEMTKMYFSVRAQEWLDEKEVEMLKGNIAPSTVKTYRTYFRCYMMPFFGGNKELKRNVKLDAEPKKKLITKQKKIVYKTLELDEPRSDMDIRDIKAADIRKFYLSLPNELSKKYQKSIIDCLENFMNAMVELDYLEHKPKGWPVISITKKVPKWIDREGQDRILSFIPEEDRPIYTFLTRQGVRPSEARSLKIKDLDLTNGIIRVARTFSNNRLWISTKTKDEVPRMINPELLPMLREICKNRFPEEYVFINPRTKRHYAQKVFSYIWIEARKKASTDIKLYNATRHSIASQAITSGAPVGAIQQVLDHSDIRTTMKYAASDISAQKVVFDTLQAKNETAKVVNIDEANRKE